MKTALLILGLMLTGCASQNVIMQTPLQCSLNCMNHCQEHCQCDHCDSACMDHCNL